MKLERLIAISAVLSLEAFAAPLPACPQPDGSCFGEVPFSTGDRYLGEMVKFKMEGSGAMFGVDGSLKQTGTWANSKLVTSSFVDFSAFLPTYPKFKSQLLEAAKQLEAWRDRERVRTYLERESTDQLWSVRVSNAVTKVMHDWLEGPAAPPEEVPPPKLPEPPKLTRESWESNKEFEARSATAKADYRKETARLEAEYRDKVADRKAWLKQAGIERSKRAAKLGPTTREFTHQALSFISLRIAQRSAQVDPDRGVLIVELAIDDAPAVRYEFPGAPVELRKAAVSNSAVTYTPEFLIKDAGQVAIKSIRATAGPVSANGFQATK